MFSLFLFPKKMKSAQRQNKKICACDDGSKISGGGRVVYIAWYAGLHMLFFFFSYCDDGVVMRGGG